MRFVLVVVMLAGCIEPNLVTCADGIVCSPAQECLPGGGGCATPQDIAECAGQVEGAQCVSGGVADGVCIHGGCTRPRCGDGLVAPNEICDDGNVDSGDGCRGDCRSDETCGNGELDAIVGEECDDGNLVDNDLCQATCRVPRCGDGIVGPLELCDLGNANSDAPDAICRTNCQPRRCGDGILDTGEVCDDANPIAGDGCAVDCLSTETCGNGIIDASVGEQCEDGNTRNLDGCSGNCRVESMGWTVVNPGFYIPRDRAAAAYDAARHRTVMFGGQQSSTGALDDTWEFDGKVWIAVTPLTKPPARHSHAMVYDADRKRVLMFGGRSGTTNFNDAWEYDGVTWKQITFSGAAPSPRQLPAMAYDGKHHRIVLFGGLGSTSLGDTWQLVGTTWTDLTVATAPQVRNAAAMAFDAKRGVVVLYGGFPIRPQDTWELDGSTWTSSSATIAGRNLHAMVYDIARQTVVVYGGSPVSDTYEFDGATWTAITTNVPDKIRSPAMTYDVSKQQIVLTSGLDQLSSRLNGTWLLGANPTPNDWIGYAAPSRPVNRSAHALAYDSRRGRVVLYGGLDDFGGALDDTWYFTGTSWERGPTLSSPGARSGHAMVYDVENDVIELFGGYTSAAGLSRDTRKLVPGNYAPDDAQWRVAPDGPDVPPIREHHSMVHDPVNNRTIMFGGLGIAGRLDDTWIYNGFVWTDAQPSTGPIGRDSHALAYDSRHGEVVMFGGQNTPTQFTNETWKVAYVGGQWQWQQLFPSTTPPAIAGHSMTYDPVRGSVIAYLAPTNTWSFASTWSPIGIAPAPLSRASSSMVYAPAFRSVLFFGGSTGGASDVGDTWTLGYRPVVAGEACSSGIDYDHDTKVGCTDEDCWGQCTPQCPPGSLCGTTNHRCGDATCDPFEDCRACPQDCAVGTAACPLTCGDFLCDPGETAASCPGDC